MAQAKFDVYEEVTAQIISALENGVKPWECPWVSAVTVCTENQSECFKIKTEKEAACRILEESDVFGQVVVAPRGSFSISNPYSVQEYVADRFGYDHVEILFTNGEDETDHW